MAKGANRGTGGSGGKKQKAEKKAELPQQRQPSSSGNTPHARAGQIAPHFGKKSKKHR
jgi:hypothetical protein